MTTKINLIGKVELGLKPHFERFLDSLSGRDKSRFKATLSQLMGFLGPELVLPNRALLADLPNRLRRYLREKDLQAESVKNYGYWTQRAIHWITTNDASLAGLENLPESFPELMPDTDDQNQRYWKGYRRHKLWCGTHQVPLSNLNKGVFREYQKFLLGSYEYLTARSYYSALLTFWRVRSERWELPLLEVPDMSRKGAGHYGLGRERWPRGILEDFERFFRFSRYGETINGRRSKEFRDLAAEKGYAMVLSTYLGYLVNIGGIDISDLDLRNVIGNEEWVMEFIRWHKMTRSQGKDANVHQRVLERLGILLDELWRDPLGATYKDYAHQLDPVRKEPRFEETLIPFEKLILAAQKALKDAVEYCKKPARKKTDLVKQAVVFHDALLFAVLILRPIRETNLINLALGLSLMEMADGRHEFLVSSVEEKGRKPYRIVFPRWLEDPLREYLTHWRPILNQKNSNLVFMTKRGGRLTPKLLNDRTIAMGEKYLGIAKTNPHFFRKLVVSSYLQKWPHQMETTRQLLGHRRLETTLKYYIHIHTLHASRRAAQFARDTCEEFRKLGACFPRRK